MSWSGHKTPVGGTPAVDTFTFTPPYESAEPHVKEAMQAACGAAWTLITSGVLGDLAEHEFNVNLSGHANPDHEPTSGWTNDHISVQVTQV